MRLAVSAVAALTLAVPALTAHSTLVLERESTDNSDVASDFLSALIYNATQANVTDAGDRRLAAKSLTVDVGYAKYQGYYETTSGLNIWKGCVQLISSYRLWMVSWEFPILLYTLSDSRASID